MGLIKSVFNTAIGSAQSTLKDTYKEFFYCDALPSSILVKRGFKRSNGKNDNNGGDNIISNGSIITVADGQIMLLVQQGRVTDFCAEPGEFKLDNSIQPSLLAGKFGESLKETFKQIGRRFTFGGDTATEQRVYYINTLEIMDNRFGTKSPIPYRVVDNNIGLDTDVSVRCNGEYSFFIEDPLIFYTKVAGNVVDSYPTSNLQSLMMSEFLTALQPAFGMLSEKGIRYSSLPAHTMEIKEALNKVLSKEWREMRGIKVKSVAINSATISPEDQERIKTLQMNAVLAKNPAMAGATIAAAQAEAMKLAAANESTGPMMAFAGMNFAANAGGMNSASLYGMQQQPMQPQSPTPAPTPAPAPAPTPTPAPASASSGWTCECGTQNTGKFCMNCGKPQPKPVSNSWVCKCGTTNTGKFCMDCGMAKPGAKIKCDKCGYEPDTSKAIPKFCPECGDPIDNNDRI